MDEPSVAERLPSQEEEDVEDEEESSDADEEEIDSDDESESGDEEIEEEGEGKEDATEEEGEVGEDEEDGDDSDDEEEADEREENEGFSILGPEKPSKSVPAVPTPGIHPSSAPALNPVRSFDEMGLDPRLLRGLVKRRLLKPTPVQQYCVPLAMEGRDVVAMAHTGSGKTLAYLLPLLHRVLADKDSAPAAAGAGGTCPRAVVLVPTRELCQQVADEVTAMAQYCGGAISVQRLTTGMNNSAMRAAMDRRPDVVVATPARMAACVAEGVLAASALKTHLAVMVLDEGRGQMVWVGGVCGGGDAGALGAQDTRRCHGAGRAQHFHTSSLSPVAFVPCQQADVLLSHGYYSEVQAIARHVPVSCQCLLLTATFSDDIERLQKLVLHNPVVVRLGDSSGLLEDAQGGAGGAGGVVLGKGVGVGQTAAEAAAAGEAAEAGAGGQGNQNQSLLPPNIRQFAVRCQEKDKLLHLLALIRLQLLQKKVLIFTSTVEAGFRVKLFLEQFGIRAAVLNSELPVASRLHILHDFNAGKFFFLIATDDDNGGLNAKDNGKQGNSGRDAKRRRVRIAEGGEAGEEEVERDTGEYGVVRGIDFKNVRTVINYSVPNQLAPYVHRVGRTGRASSVGMSITLVSPKEVPLLEALDRKISQSMACATKGGGGGESNKGGTHDGSAQGSEGVKGKSGSGSSRKRAREGEDEEGGESEEEGEVEEEEEEGEEEGTDEEEEELEESEEEEESDESDESGEEESDEEEEEEGPAKPKPYECKAIVAYPYLPKEGVEALRYRGEDVAGKITRVAIREARAKELRWEILNSEKLKDHFDLNPNDRDLLKHDKVLAKVAPSPHLKVLPTYLRAEAVTEARRKFLTELPPAEQDSRDGRKGGSGGRGGGFNRGHRGRSGGRGGGGGGRGRGGRGGRGRSNDPLKTFSAK
ncbi:unnamed protein product [Closterium sp. Yama58-4]|nr:unnamed protein product [Closterium sp. Yama58-4]